MSSPFLLLLFLLPIIAELSSATDRLSLGESITTNRTMLLSSGNFVLGFFSPSNDTSLSYLGIWHAVSSPLTAIWVANRLSPVPFHRAVFRLSNTASLEVSDSNGTILWSSNNSLPPPTIYNDTIALLLDTGNLVVRTNDDDSILWQTFDHPTDTVLPRMPLSVNYHTHYTISATSWRSPVDPSPGKFMTLLDPNTRLQVLIMRGQTRWFRSNVWNGASFTARGTIGDQSYLSFSLSRDLWNLSFVSLELLGSMKFKLEYNGLAHVLLWIPGLDQWRAIYTFNDQYCDSYEPCGPNAYCAMARPVCTCLDGFEPRDPRGWDGGDYKGGCARIDGPSGCDGRDRFVRVGQMKLPDHNVYLMDVKNGCECGEVCRSNCSCVAYAYADLSIPPATLPRCLVWFGDLVDLVLRTDNSGEDLFVKVRVADLGFEKEQDGHWTSNDIGEAHHLFNLNRLISNDVEQGRQDLPLLDYEVILSATNNFSDLNKIGHGGFGNVYKGKLPDGSEVAIKRLSEESGQGLVEFTNEIVLIAKLQHRNLVKLLNCCIHTEEKLLVYEYMPNRSLELYLFNSEKQWMLEWEKRFNIIKGIARGLLYLHEDSRLKIIHRDLKASNVLLDEDMNAKISDFGLARIVEGCQSLANTRRVVGTYGYMSPEYAMEGLFSVKSDVYSFGVLLLEIISGQRNTSVRSTFPSLLSYAWELWNSGSSKEIVSASIRDSCELSEVERCIHIGLLCVNDDPVNRPNMSSVVFMLENQTQLKSKPEKPSFTGWTSCNDITRKNSNTNHHQTVNTLSISVMEAR